MVYLCPEGRIAELALFEEKGVLDRRWVRRLAGVVSFVSSAHFSFVRSEGGDSVRS